MTLSKKEFVACYGALYEHSPWVAERSFRTSAGETLDELSALFANCVNSASREERLALIRAHPDLAGRAAIGGQLTAESNVEQASAGIDQCSEDEYREFVRLNDAYKAKFDFPFVMAVRNSDRKKILAAFRTRINNDAGQEFDTAISEIHKIAKLRLEAILRHG